MNRLACLLAFCCLGPALAAQTFDIASPNGRQTARVEIATMDGCARISYSTALDGRPVVLPSALDLTVDNHIWEMATGKRSVPSLERWFDNLELTGTETFSRDEVWHNAFGERSEVRDAFHGIVLHFKKEDTSLCALDIEFRAYDEGSAFRYSLP